MKSTIKETSPTQRHIDVSAAPEELASIKKIVTAKLSAGVKVAGFRSGKAPADLVEKQIDSNVLQAEFVQTAVNKLYLAAINEHKIRPLSAPKIDVTKFVPYTTLEFHADIEVIGEIKLGQYKKLGLKAKTVKILPKDIDDILSNLKKRSATKKEVTRAAKMGDEVIIDFSGADMDGKAIAGTDGKDYPLGLGSKSFIPGFEEEIVGMKAEEQKTFKVTFPKNYGVAALKNKPVNFSVKVKKIKDLTEPELNDEFAKSVANFSGMKELKADIEEQLKIERTNQAKRDLEDELVRKVSSKTEVALPKVLLEDQLSRMVEESKRNAAYQGLSWDDFLAQNSVTEEQLRAKMEPDATERIKAGLALSEIAEIEGITVKFEEVDAQIAALKEQYKSDPKMIEELDKPENRNDIASQILARKTVSFLIANN